MSEAVVGYEQPETMFISKSRFKREIRKFLRIKTPFVLKVTSNGDVKWVVQDIASFEKMKAAINLN